MLVYFQTLRRKRQTWRDALDVFWDELAKVTNGHSYAVRSYFDNKYGFFCCVDVFIKPED